MRDVALFFEDFAHQQFLTALLKRLAAEYRVPVQLDWRNARCGHGAVLHELKQYLRDLQFGRDRLPDLVVVATDANCKGVTERSREIKEVTDKVAVSTVCAVPAPHIERWLMLDSVAFKAVFGRGCDPPDEKCEGRVTRRGWSMQSEIRGLLRVLAGLNSPKISSVEWTWIGPVETMLR